MTAILERKPLRATDGAELRLARLKGGDKGPLLVVHGAGVNSSMFLTPTPREPFAPYLARNGWDVWLLDWRGSIDVPMTQFTLDEAAQYDYPAACNAILEETQADSLQAMVHCVGSIGFFMSLSRGFLPKVRSVVASQVALHLKVPTLTDAKVFFHVPETLPKLGLEALSAHEEPDHPLYQTCLDIFLDLTHHECKSRTCHRITYMFGLLWQHANLSVQMHDHDIESLFGPCNLRTFQHLAQMVRAGSAQTFDDGKGVPISDLRPERFNMPIALLSGEHNKTFTPESTELTFNWLREKNGERNYQRRVTAGYGHIDNYLGQRSDLDTYPVYLELLEGHWAGR